MRLAKVILAKSESKLKPRPRRTGEECRKSRSVICFQLDLEYHRRDLYIWHVRQSGPLYVVWPCRNCLYVSLALRVSLKADFFPMYMTLLEGIGRRCRSTLLHQSLRRVRYRFKNRHEEKQSRSVGVRLTNPNPHRCDWPKSFWLSVCGAAADLERCQQC